MERSNVWLATTLLNARVRSSAGENLGKIEDLAIDPATGNLEYAILSFGGVVGMGKKLVPVPWTSLGISTSRDYVLFDADKESLLNAPSFAPDAWADLSDPGWRRRVSDYYGGPRVAAVNRPVYVPPRTVPARQGMSVVAAILLIIGVLFLGWMTFLVSTRGWDQAKQDVKSSFQSAAYAAKETSKDAALTSKVKTALALSKRIPSDKINVDSDGNVVTLRGEVPSQETRDLAERIVKDVPGVGEVHNHLYAISGSQ